LSADKLFCIDAFKLVQKLETISSLLIHSVIASMRKLRPSALDSQLAFRVLGIFDSSPLAGSRSFPKPSHAASAIGSRQRGGRLHQARAERQLRLPEVAREATLKTLFRDLALFTAEELLRPNQNQ
jgi:hypothetical protein